jgi:large subunit ribosomal protein L9
MEVLLLTDIAGVGKKNDLIVVKSGFALNHLLPSRQALVVTPSVRKRYAESIKQRALERERDREMAASLSSALSGKIVHIVAKASKAKKLYASISEQMISDALKQEHALTIPASSITLSEHIKTVGLHTATIAISGQKTEVKIDVAAAEEAKA